MIYGPPDTVSIDGGLIAATVNLKRNQDDYVQVDPGLHEYLLRDGHTMQTAIAAARAEGLEQGLREAAATVKECVMEAYMTQPPRVDLQYARYQFSASILALIPALPAPSKTPDE